MYLHSFYLLETKHSIFSSLSCSTFLYLRSQGQCLQEPLVKMAPETKSFFYTWIIYPTDVPKDQRPVTLQPSFWVLTLVQFSSVTQTCPTLCDPMDCSMPGFPVHHQLLELTQTHVNWVGDAIQQSHPLSSPSPLAFNLSRHKDLFQGVSSSHQVAKVLEFQLKHQSFQWIFRTDFL